MRGAEERKKEKNIVVVAQQKKGDSLFSASPFLESGDRDLVIGPLQRRAA
jgi:hypothetical protein